MSALLHDAVVGALRTLFLIGLPVVVVVSIAGTVISAFQSATTVQDPASAYAFRLVALIALLYFMAPSFIRTVLTFGESVFR